VKVLTLIVGGATLVLVARPAIGGLILLGTRAPFGFVIAGVVYALFMPVVGITTTFVYHDALVREHLSATEPRSAVLPAKLAPS
jgi:hypothetical protein